MTPKDQPNHVVRLCGNVSQRQQKGGGDGRQYSESMSELASAKMIIDARSSDSIASTGMVDPFSCRLLNCCLF